MPFMLMVALYREGDVQEVKTLLASVEDPSASDYDKRTALHIA